MTREEAIEQLQDAKDGYQEYLSAEALDMAIKALEQETVSKESYDHEYFLRKELEMKIAKLEQQEPILDKIRAEIEKTKTTMNMFNREDTKQYAIAMEDVLKIIDKVQGRK